MEAAVRLPIFATETTNDRQPVTMCLTPMTVDLSQDQVKVQNLKSVVGKFVKSTVKFLLFISPVYPHVV